MNFLHRQPSRSAAPAVLVQLQRQQDLILNAVGVGVQVIDQQGLIVFANVEAARLLGWSLEELIGKPAHPISHHTKADGTPYPSEECPIDLTSRDGVIYHGDADSFWRKDGTSFRVAYTSTPLRDDAGQIIGTVLTFRDVSVRKQAEDTLVAEARFLRAQTDVAQVAMSSLHPEVLMPSLLEAISHAQGYASGLFWRLIEAEQALTVEATFGAGTAPFHGLCFNVNDADFLTAQAIRSRQPAFRNHLQQSHFATQQISQTLGTKALLALPLIDRSGKVIGALSFGDTEDPERFTERDLTQGMVLAGKVAQAMENSELFRRVQQLEAQYRAVTESLNDAVYTVDHAGRITFGNAALERLTGYRRDVLLGLPSLGLYSVDDQVVLQERRREVFKGVALPPVEVELLCSDGRRMACELSGTPLLGDGQIIGGVGVLRDITARKQAEHALRDSEERFRQMAEHIQQVFWMSNSDLSEVLYVSPAYAAVWGRSCESLYERPMSFLEAVHPDDRERVIANLLRKQLTPGPEQGAFEMEYRIVRPDGEVRWIHDRGFPLWDEQGQLERMVGCSEDTTVRKQAEQEVEQRRQEAEVLAELARSVSASLDLDTVLMRVTEGARAVCRSDAASLALRDPHSQAMLLRYWNGVRWPESEALRVEPGQGVGGQVLLTGRPFRTDHYVDDPRVSSNFSQVAFLRGLVAVMAVPIWIGGRMEGIVYVANCAPQPFTDHDEAILQRLADQAAIAIQNARLYQEQTRRQAEVRALLEINKTLGQVHELPALLDTIAEEAAHLLDVPWVTFRLREGNKLPVVGAWAQPGLEMVRSTLEVGQSLGGWVVATGEPLIVNDIIQDDRPVPEARARMTRLGYVAFLGVPLRLGAEVIGSMGFRAKRTRPFTEHDRELAIAFADQAAIAVQHARLYTQAERRRAAAESLTELAWILSQSLDPAEVGQRLVDVIRPLVGAQGASLYRLEPQSGDLWAIAVSSNSPASFFRPRVLPQDPSVLGLAVRARGPVVSPNTLTDPRLSMTPELQAQLEQLSPRAVLSVPLLLQDEVIGVLGIVDDAGREFSTEEIQLVQALAIQAATALGNARLYQEAQEAYRQLSCTQAQFVQAQKMEAVGRLAGGVAHDFNNLLTIITGRAQLQLMRLPADHPMRRDLELIHSAATRAATLTGQLLAFSRRQVLQPKVLDLNALVHEISLLLRRLIGEDITLVTVLDPALGQVRADPGQLEQVLLNLAVNARDAMPEGGQLTLETTNIERHEADGRGEPGIPPGRYVQLRVRDTGIGMDAAVRAHLFEPFFTTKEVGKGTGLGLAMVYGIVTQSGGHIAVDTAPGRGTTFTLYLPRADGLPAASQSGQTPTALLRGQATILLVEDDADVRSLAYDILAETGYRVVSASSGAEALQRCEQQAGAIDLLLTDVVMPGMSGRELAGRVMHRWPRVKILFMSGYPDEMLGRHGALDPSISFLEKPFSPESLTRKVREVLPVDRP